VLIGFWGLLWGLGVGFLANPHLPHFNVGARRRSEPEMVEEVEA